MAGLLLSRRYPVRGLLLIVSPRADKVWQNELLHDRQVRIRAQLHIGKVKELPCCLQDR